jgi:AAA+ ATPase superfamily predicted ATPase
VQRLPHHEALQRTISEGTKIVKDELDHFLAGRDKTSYIAALKAAATSARWKETKGAIEARKGAVNDATIQNVLENLKAAMLIEKKDGVYAVQDPMLRTVLLTSQIT